MLQRRFRKRQAAYFQVPMGDLVKALKMQAQAELSYALDPTSLESRINYALYQHAVCHARRTFSERSRTLNIECHRCMSHSYGTGISHCRAVCCSVRIVDRQDYELARVLYQQALQDKDQQRHPLVHYSVALLLLADDSASAAQRDLETVVVKANEMLERVHTIDHSP